MRVIRAPAELSKALKTAQREAEAAFGVGDVYIEKYVEQPAAHRVPGARRSPRRGRAPGRARMLDPAPASEAARGRALGRGDREDAAQARQHASSTRRAPCSTRTPGTFEFLLDDKGNFYFLEVNTRIQVEHPVTEFITGVDIVKEQIRIAAGERLSFKQGDVTFTGHAIECRVNAEDPETFAPSPGTIHAFSVPGGPGVRVDTFAHSECTIPPYYDSMIAKIIVHGRDRQEAIARMRRTLEMTVIEGIKTSIPLHLKILADPDFVAGRLDTAFMDRYLAKRSVDGKPAGRSRLRVLVVSSRAVIPVRLYPIVDCRVLMTPRAGRSTRSTLAEACLRGGARILQLRAKHGSERDVPDTGRRACGLRRSRRGARVIVNDRADIALHVRGRWRARRTGRPAGRRASAARRGRRHRRRLDARPRRRWTRRCRRRPTTSRSDRCSPPTPRHRLRARGLDLVALRRRPRQAGRRHRGITLERAPAVLAAGAAAVAVISDLLVGGDPEARRSRLRRQRLPASSRFKV